MLLPGDANATTPFEWTAIRGAHFVRNSMAFHAWMDVVNFKGATASAHLRKQFRVWQQKCLSSFDVKLEFVKALSLKWMSLKTFRPPGRSHDVV